MFMHKVEYEVLCHTKQLNNAYGQISMWTTLFALKQDNCAKKGKNCCKSVKEGKIIITVAWWERVTYLAHVAFITLESGKIHDRVTLMNF